MLLEADAPPGIETVGAAAVLALKPGAGGALAASAEVEADGCDLLLLKLNFCQSDDVLVVLQPTAESKLSATKARNAVETRMTHFLV